MQYLGCSLTKQDGMKNFYAGLLDVFCPAEQLDESRVRNLFMVMPLGGASLSSVLSKAQLKPCQVKKILYQILCAVNYLHSLNMIHRDLKSLNVLVDDHCAVRLCDFGLARSLPESSVGKHNGQCSKIRHSVLTKL